MFFSTNLEYIDNIYKNRYIKYKFETFNTGFKIALYEAFNHTFNENNNIKDIGSYFHYILNLRKYLVSKGLTTKKMK